MIQIIIAIILSYLIGSIPTSIIVAKLVKGIDIRDPETEELDKIIHESAQRDDSQLRERVHG